MRLFVGIKTGCEDYLTALQEELKKCGRGSFTHAVNLHLTLKFLGEVPPQSISDISSAMKEVNALPFSLECRGVKMFGRSGIVSAEVGGNLFALSSLATQLEEALEKKGFTKETRSFKPHITLAREFRPCPGWNISSIPRGCHAFTVDEMILFESKREAGRLVYVPVYRRELSGR